MGRNQSAVQTVPVGNGLLRFACANARYVRNKVADVVDLVVNSNIDICVITETWLKDCDSVTVAGMSPSGYSFENSPRKAARSGGGLVLMFKSMMRTKLVDASEYRSFESSEWNITLQSHVIKLVAVYRPPSATALYVPSSLFFEEFSIYLESVVTSTELLLISGDFNFHLNSAEDNNTKKFCDLLETFGLTQHVTFSTHNSGHILDLIITRSVNDVLISKVEPTLALSGHTAICVQAQTANIFARLFTFET